MAKVSKKAVERIIANYRKKGLSDTQIHIELSKRKDAVGKNWNAAIDRAVQSGIDNPLEAVTGQFGLNVGRAEGSKVAGRVNKDASVTDKAKSYATSLAMGVADSTAGIAQGIHYGTDKLGITESAYEDYNETYDKANAVTDVLRSEAGRGGADVTRLGGEIAATLPTFLVGTGAPTLGARVGIQAGVGGLAGASRYAEDADDRLKNTAFGAAGGGLGQAGGEIAGKALSAGARRVVSSKPITTIRNARNGVRSAGVREIDDLAEQYGVRTSAGDAGGGSIVGNFETQLERVPVVGMAGFRAGQQTEAKAAAVNVTEGVKKAMSEADYKALPRLKQAAEAGDRNANRILNIVENAGDDAGRVLQASAEMTAWREKQIAGKLYDRVGELVAKSGDDTITPNKTLSMIDDELEKASQALAPDDSLVSDLEKIRSRLIDPNKPKTFANMRQFRSQLGDLANKYVKGANPNKSAAKFIGDLRETVSKDIDEYITRVDNPAIKTAYQKADKFYSKTLRKSDRAIARAMDSNKPDEIYAQFIKRGKGDRASVFYNNLDQKGQAALRYQMAEDALDKAIHPSTGDFSPAKFAGEFERMSEPYERIFKAEAKKQMDGFVKLMRHIERAGQYAENPPTGVRLTDVAMGAGAIVAPAFAIKAGTLSLMARTLFTTKAGKNLLLASSEVPPESVAMTNILKNVEKIMQRTGAAAGYQESQTRNPANAVRADEKAVAPTF